MARLTFVLEAVADPETRQTFDIETDGHYTITTTDGKVDITKDDEDEWNQKERLAHLTIHGTHVTLRATCGPCTVAPPGSSSPGEQWEQISLPKSTRRCQYHVVLRPDDRVTLRSSMWARPLCTFSVQVEDVQVESSVPVHPEEEVRQRRYLDLIETSIDPMKLVEEADRRSREDEENSPPDVVHEKAPVATPAVTSTVSQVVNETPAPERIQNLGKGISVYSEATIIPPSYAQPEYILGDADDAFTDEDADEHYNVAGKHDQMNVSGEHDDGNVSAMNEQKNASENHDDDRKVTAKSDQAITPEDHDEEDITTASESENEDEPIEEQSPSHTSLLSNQNKRSEANPSNHAHTEEVKKSVDQNHDFAQHKKSGALQRIPSPRVEIPATQGYKRAAEEEDAPRATKKQAMADARREPVSDTPPSSNRSRRSAANDHDEECENGLLQVVFSNSTVQTRPSTLKFLSRQGVKIQESVTNGCDFLCVNASGQLKKSFKLLMSVILGKPIISDEWVVKSVVAKKLVDHESFITTNTPSEWQWGSSREEVTAALKRDRSRLFEGFDIIVTPQLKKEYGDGYKDIEKLLKECGAAKVVSKQARSQDPSGSTVVIGSENGDADVIKLSDSDDGWSCFSRELISMSILRGDLNLESDEFKLQPNKSGSKKPGKPGRQKKSK
ncbi:hypothetical protein IWX49DRAFT_590528 [Phyllosticta citricarpa]|uniref:BRCT domain-containing protein n=2 Tax=Phyllosticta TaxID=121621 RepID=A0ABR1LT44_9PEZI